MVLDSIVGRPNPTNPWAYPPNLLPPQLSIKRREAEEGWNGVRELSELLTSELVDRAQQIARAHHPILISPRDHLLNSSFHQRVEEVCFLIDYVSKRDAEFREGFQAWAAEAQQQSDEILPEPTDWVSNERGHRILRSPERFPNVPPSGYPASSGSRSSSLSRTPSSSSTEYS